MTEKRFTHKKWYDERQLFDGEEAFAIVDTGTQASIICNRLNKLSDENEKFKKALIELKEIGDYQYSRIKELSDENEQLKKELDKLKLVNEMLSMYFSNSEHELWKENEQLKSELQRIYDITTVNKVKNIVEEIYDDLLYETSEKSDYAREKVLQCLEKIGGFGDDLE